MKKIVLTTTRAAGRVPISYGGIVAALLAALGTMNTFAEKADRTKEIEIGAAAAKSDIANNVQTLDGAVVLTQGTMRITADRMILKRDAKDNIFAELLGLNGNQISFKEKREGFNDFMEGASDRAEFDQATSTIKLFTRARLKNGNDVLSGEYIYYNSTTDVMLADGRAPDNKSGRDPKASAAQPGRVRITIQPRIDPTPASQRSAPAESSATPAKK